MLKIGIIREGKNPPDSRVPLTPQQCKDILRKYKNVDIFIQPSPIRCFTDQEYEDLGIQISNDLSHCNLLLGVKEAPVQQLIPNQSYMFFSHTKKKQDYNQSLMHALIEKKIKMIDYELLTYEDGKRIIGFGFFAGVVGAHNGILAYGKKHNLYELKPAHKCKDMEEMVQQYLDIKLPPIKIALTGSGRVAAGLLDIMEKWQILNAEPEDFLNKDYDYPVYTLLKGADLYEHKKWKHFDREEFHKDPKSYFCKFPKYTKAADILMNGIYWDENIERLFDKEEIKHHDFKISVIADVTCDIHGSIPINLGASSIAEPVYGIKKSTFEKATPYQNSKNTIDVMAVDNLPNELPRDASVHFGKSIMKFVLPEFLKTKSDILDRATICQNGKLTEHFEYLSDYAYKQ